MRELYDNFSLLKLSVTGANILYIRYRKVSFYFKISIALRIEQKKVFSFFCNFYMKHFFFFTKLFLIGKLN